MDKSCTKCKEIFPFESFSNDKYRKDGKSAWCQPCRNANARSRPTSAKRRAYNLQYQQDNKKRLLAMAKAWHKANNYESNTKWRLNNKDKAAATSARYRAQKLRATPPWLTEEHHAQIAAFYKEAQERGLVVDHIIPLRNRLVCGLHVPWNLQLLTKSENSQKSNTLLAD